MKPLKWRRTNAQVWSLLLGKGGKITITYENLYHRFGLRAFGENKAFNTVAEAMNFVDEHFGDMVDPAKAVATERANSLGEAHRLFDLCGIDRSALKKGEVDEP